MNCFSSGLFLFVIHLSLRQITHLARPPRTKAPSLSSAQTNTVSSSSSTSSYTSCSSCSLSSLTPFPALSPLGAAVLQLVVGGAALAVLVPVLVFVVPAKGQLGGHGGVEDRGAPPSL